MAKSRVVVDTRGIKVFEGEMRRAVERGLTRGAREVAAGAHAVKTNYDLAEVLASIEVHPPEKTRRGIEVSVSAKDWRARFFLKGTYARRGRARSARAAAVEGNRGVKPVRFLQRPLGLVRKRLPDLIRSELR